MASCRIPQLLALEVSTATRQAQGASRSSAADPRDRLANPLWGAPRIHGELLKLGIDVGQTSVCQVHGPTPAPTLAGLENVPPEPCRWDRLDRPFRGSDDLLPAAIRIAGPPTRSKAHPVARRHCAPECRMDR